MPSSPASNFDKYGTSQTPPMYETSISTAEDSHSSGSARRGNTQRLASALQSEYNRSQMMPSRYNSSSRHDEPSFSSPRQQRYPKLRKAASEPDVSADDDRHLQMHRRPSPPASDVGAFTVKYNNIHPKHRQILENDRVISSRDYSSEKRAASAPLAGNGQPRYHKDMRSKLDAAHHLKKGTKQEKYSSKQAPEHHNLDESFGSIETPSVSSVQDLKKMLWNDNEELQVIKASIDRLNNTLERHTRPSRSLSPTRRISMDNTFDSDSTSGTGFKNKYYQAVIAARDREFRASSPMNRSVDNRANKSSLSLEQTEKQHRQYGYEKGRNHPSSLEIPPLRSASFEAKNHPSRGQSSAHAPASETPEKSPRRSRSQPLSPFIKELERKNIGKTSNSLSFDAQMKSFDEQARKGKLGKSSPQLRSPSPPRARRGDVTEEGHSERSRSRTRDSGNVGTRQQRRRTPSPMIQERMREFIQEPRHEVTPVQKHSHAPRDNKNERKQKILSSSVERSDPGYDRDRKDADGPGVDDRATRNAMPNKTIRRMTTIKDAPTSRSSPLENRPPTPIIHQGTAGAYGHVEKKQQRSEAIAHWQKKTKMSSTTPNSYDSPVSLPNYHFEHSVGGALDTRQRSIHDTGTTLETKEDVAELVAKLSAVNRSNPAAALEQIDSILRQQASAGKLSSLDGSRQRGNDFIDIATPTASAYADEDLIFQADDDDDSEYDDDTTISSVTNPTFQSTNTANGTSASPSKQESRSLHPFAPPAISTASFRPSRPSNLQKYSSATQPPENAGKRTPRPQVGSDESPVKVSRGEAQLEEPHATRSLKALDSPYSARSISQQSIVQQSDEPSESAADINKDEYWTKRSGMASSSEQVKISVPNHDDPYFGNGASDSADDEGSRAENRHNGMRGRSVGIEYESSSRRPKIDPGGRSSRSPKARKSSEAKQFRPKDQSVGLNQTFPGRLLPTSHNRQASRSHPWDSEISTRCQQVSMRDTSMEDATGIETEIYYKKPFAGDRTEPFSSRNRFMETEEAKPLRGTSQYSARESSVVRRAKFNTTGELETLYPSMDSIHDQRDTRHRHSTLENPSTSWSGENARKDNPRASNRNGDATEVEGNGRYAHYPRNEMESPRPGQPASTHKPTNFLHHVESPMQEQVKRPNRAKTSTTKIPSNPFDDTDRENEVRSDLRRQTRPSADHLVRDRALIEAFPDDPEMFFEPGLSIGKSGNRDGSHKDRPRMNSANPFEEECALEVHGGFPLKVPDLNGRASIKREDEGLEVLDSDLPYSHNGDPGITSSSPPRRNTSRTVPSRHRGGPVDLDDSLDIPSCVSSHGPTSKRTEMPSAVKNVTPRGNVETSAIEVTLLSDDDDDFLNTSGESLNTSRESLNTSRESLNRSGESSDRVASGKAVGDGVKKNPSKESRKGFLRAWMRKQGRKGMDLPSKSKSVTSSPSTGGYSSPHSMEQNAPQLRLQPVLPAVHESPAVIERGRLQQKQHGTTVKQRSRSTSLERIRSSNMAKKFGRVMRLYDKD